jgi:hypothetical protein
MVPEMRNMPPHEPVDLAIRMGEPGDDVFEVEVSGVSQETEMDRLVGDGITVNQLARALGIDRRTARNRVEKMGYKTVRSGPRGSIRVMPGEEKDERKGDS